MQDIVLFQYMRTLQITEQNKYFTIDELFKGEQDLIYQQSFQQNVLIAKIIKIEHIDQNVSGLNLFQIQSEIQFQKTRQFERRDFYVETQQRQFQLEEKQFYLFIDFQVMINMEIEQIFEQSYLPFVISKLDDIIPFKNISQKQKELLECIQASFKNDVIDFNYINLKHYFSNHELSINFEKTQLIQKELNNKELKHANIVGVVTEKKNDYIILNIIEQNQLTIKKIKVFYDNLKEENVYFVNNLNQTVDQMEIEELDQLQMDQKMNPIDQILQQNNIILIQEMQTKLTQSLDIIYKITSNCLIVNLGQVTDYDRIYNTVIEQQELSSFNKLSDQKVIDRRMLLVKVELKQIISLNFYKYNEKLKGTSVLIVQDDTNIAFLTLNDEDIFQFFNIQKHKETILSLLHFQQQINLKDYLNPHSFQNLQVNLRPQVYNLIQQIFYNISEKQILVKSVHNPKQENHQVNLNGTFYEDKGMNQQLMVPYLNLSQVCKLDWDQLAIGYIKTYEKLKSKTT